MTTIHHGDCIQVMNAMPADSIDAIVTDPPYGISFMSSTWDATPPGVQWAEACYRVLKPGGHIAAFGGTRTWHRLAVAIEDAGFEMRDSLAWLYGSGFPKSHDVGKAIDRMAGAEREVIGSKITGNAKQPSSRTGEFADGKHGGQQVVDVTAPATPEAAQWDGWGTALKPAFEPIVLARKPFPGTVARNVLEHGTGAINVDACRIAGDMSGGTWGAKQNSSIGFHGGTEGSGYRTARNPSGRWPANVLLDQHAAAWVDEQSGVTKGRTGMTKHSSKNRIYGEFKPTEQSLVSDGHADSGGASRFFYTAKAPKRERPTYTRPVLRLRDNLTPAQADHVRARLQEAGISLD